MVLDEFGTEALDWSLPTLKQEIHETFLADLPDENMSKLAAASLLLTSDFFYTRLPYFVKMCNMLSDVSFNIDTFDPADSNEIAWAVTEALLLDPPETDEPFSNEIRHYIGQVLDQEGIVNPPDVLGIAMWDAPRSDPLSDMTDDPELYQAAYGKQQSESDDLKAMLKEQLSELFHQIAALPLLNGDNSELLNRIRKQGLSDE